MCSKAAVVATFEEAARRTGEKLVDECGRRRFGGHSARVAGAQYLASMGLELYKLMVLARWSGPTILRYVSEAPLATITGDVKRLLACDALCDVLAEVKTRTGAMEKGISALTGAFERLEAEEHDLREQVKVLKDSGMQPVYILNTKSGVWHRLLRDGLETPVEHWSTCCGWNHSGWPVRRSASLPGDATSSSTCGRCMPARRVEPPDGSSADDAGD